MPVRKILVVDDSATNRHAISEMLEIGRASCRERV